MSAGAGPATRHDIRRGATLILCSTLMFSLMTLLAKLLGSRIPFMEIVFFRSFFALLIVAGVGLRGRATLRTRRFPGHLGRACTGLAATCCMFFSATVLPLGEQQALTYGTPIFVTLLAIPFLGERPGPHRWGAVGVGFLGILVIALGPGLLGQAHLPPPGPVDWLLLLGVGLVGGVGQLLSTEAYASAQVSSLGPYTYTALLWAALFGWLIWGDVPGPTMVLGGAMIVAAGLYILHREMRRRRAPARACAEPPPLPQKASVMPRR
jgi:drug/metabolite transporter (DMT)-like permease